MQDNQSQSLDIILRCATRLWIGLSAFFLASNAVLYFLKGKYAFEILIQEGPTSNLVLTLAGVALAWLFLGVAFALLANRSYRVRFGFPTVCALLLAFLYLNICRERTVYGDLKTYTRAAQNLSQGEPLPGRYIYPPLWANMLEPLVPFGANAILGVCWCANIFSLIAFFALLAATLRKYDFSQRFATLLAFAFTVLNVGILRTLFYAQVNLHVANAILLAVLFYPQHLFLSAFALAITVHLKSSPIVLVLPFLLERDWKWLGWFGVSMIGLASITYFTHGLQPFLDFIHNVRNVHETTGVRFRENSLDSLVRSTNATLGTPLSQSTEILTITLLKGVLLAFLLFSMFTCLKRRTFLSAQPGSTVVNALPALLLFMLLGSPLVWGHHWVFVALSYLVLIRKLDTPDEWVLYGFAYFLGYVMPTFDFYPWSFGRLASPLIVGALLYKVSLRDGNGTFFRNVEQMLSSIGQGKEESPVYRDANHAP